MNLNIQAARFRLNLLTSQDLVEIATKALEQGSESHSFAQLAGETTPIMSDVADTFLHGLQRETGPI